MKKVIRLITDKVCDVWRSGAKGKLACVTVAGVLLLIGSCLFSSNESTVKSFEEIKSEAQAKYSEMTSENWEDGARLINSMFADMAGELWKCNIKFVELLPNGILLEERSSGLPIQITQNSAGEIVFTNTITENDAITLWNMVLPIAMLKVQAELEGVKSACQRMEERNKKWADERSRQAKVREDDVNGFDKVHAEYTRFVKAFHLQDKAQLNAKDFLPMGIDVLHDSDEDWQSVKKKIDARIREEFSIFDPEDDTEWRHQREDIKRYGFQNGKKCFKIFEEKWR